MDTTADKYRQVLQQYWGYDDFRGVQREIIESVGSGRDTLGLMPTGGGKSITFQVPAMARDGLCLVITPLIALMKDQVQSLRRRGIKAAALYMGMSREEADTALNNCIFGNYKFLYVSPERLCGQFFQKKLSKMPVSLITVDEAHCISQWGYDFRPAYLEIARIRTLFPETPVLALTATATPEVCDDIMQRLEFKAPNLIRMSFRRDNLVYVVRRSEDVVGDILHILSRVPGCAIVYLRNREGTLKMAAELNSRDMSAVGYHGGLDRYEREKRQNLWMSGAVRVMVATNAFGMGIDKPDVRVVIHADSPDSPEEYFQEAGRAGRDGHLSYAVILTTSTTQSTLLRRVTESYPPPEEVIKVYERLCYYYTLAVDDGQGVSHDFEMEQFCLRFHLFPVRVMSSLKLLQMAGYLRYDEECERQSRILFLIQRDGLYRLEGFSRQDDEILRTLLRLYGGVFADYVFVSEPFVARNAGVEPEDVHNLLLMLSRRHIISYIPQRAMPRITFLRRRVDSARMTIPERMYREHRQRYRHRIEAMAGYLSQTTTCRSIYMLNYLGESGSAPCRRCDVCQQRDSQGQAVWHLLEARQWVERCLHGGQWVPLETLLDCGQIEKSLVADVLQSLTSEEVVEQDSTMFRLRV